MWTQALLVSVSLLGQNAPRTPRPAREGSPRPAAPATPVEADDRATRAAEDDPATIDATPEDPSRPLVDVKRPKQRIAARELVAESLAPPKAGGLAGRPVALAAVLSTGSQGQHLESAKLYWKLVTAVAEHHYALDEYQRLLTLVQPDGPPAAPGARPGRRIDDRHLSERLQIEQSAARARVREAELTAMQLQVELAALLGTAADDPLPLPGDAPHVGPYRTHFPQAFGGGKATPRLRLIARSLPVQLEVIELRAQAILSAEDSAVSTIEGYNKGDTKLAAVSARLSELGRQRRMLMNAVRAYNDNIAEYAVAAAGDKAAGAELAGMMIKTHPSAASGGSSGTPREAQPRPARPPVEADPDAETPIDMDDAAAERSAGSSPRRRYVGRVRSDRSTTEPWDESADGAENGAEHAVTPLYSALVSFDPVKRGHKVAESLNFDDHLPPDSGMAIGLEELLAAAPVDSRRSLVKAYWRAREQVARHHVLTEQLQQLQAYTPLLLEKHNADLGAREMIDLRTAKLAAEAALLEARLALQEAQLELTLAAGRTADGPWLLPSTPPHSGRYKVDNAAPPAGGAGRSKRLAATAVTSLHESLVDRAAAVVLADSARVQSATDYKINQQTIDELLQAVEIQTQESLDFLAALTRYNQSIMDYVVMVLPAGVSPQQLAGSLVVLPKQRPPHE